MIKKYFPVQSQRSSILYGNYIEKVLHQIAYTKTNQHHIQGFPHQVDLCYKINDTIYYLEVKTNLRLDSEKIKATVYKLNKAKEILQRTHPDHKVHCLILNPLCTTSDIQVKLHKNIRDNSIGIDRFFQSLNLNISFDEWISELQSKYIIVID